MPLLVSGCPEKSSEIQLIPETSRLQHLIWGKSQNNQSSWVLVWLLKQKTQNTTPAKTSGSPIKSPKRAAQQPLCCPGGANTATTDTHTSGNRLLDLISATHNPDFHPGRLPCWLVLGTQRKPINLIRGEGARVHRAGAKAAQFIAQMEKEEAWAALMEQQPIMQRSNAEPINTMSIWADIYSPSGRSLISPLNLSLCSRKQAAARRLYNEKTNAASLVSIRTHGDRFLKIIIIRMLGRGWLTVR